MRQHTIGSAIALAAAGLVSFTAGASAAQPARTITAQPQVLMAALREADLAPTLGTDGVGDPMISGTSGGAKFVLLFHNCTDHRDCTTIQLAASWARQVKPSYGAINTWNRKHRFGTAFTDDDGDPGVKRDIDLDEGGMSPELFQDELSVWTQVMKSFVADFPEP